jgi:hypothetical protein
MTSFLEKAGRRVSREFADTAAGILQAMGLPDPQGGEFVNGHESDLVMLDDYGLVVRAGLKMQCREHARILSPLRASDAFESKGYEFVVEVLPGIRGGVYDYLERQDLQQTLSLDGILFWDDGIDNCGYLPLATPQFPKGIPVVLDRGGVKEESSYALKEDFNAAAELAAQKKIYAKLHEALAQDWPEGKALPVAPLARFMRACRDDMARPGGVLCGEWESPERGMIFRNLHEPDKTTLAALTGSAYAQRLRGLKNG